jgi:hypothetical protein
MAERVTLTAEEAEALRKLRAQHRNESFASDEPEWVVVDNDTRPHKVLVLQDTSTGTT